MVSVTEQTRFGASSGKILAVEAYRCCLRSFPSRTFPPGPTSNLNVSHSSTAAVRKQCERLIWFYMTLYDHAQFLVQRACKNLYRSTYLKATTAASRASVSRTRTKGQCEVIVNSTSVQSTFVKQRTGHLLVNRAVVQLTHDVKRLVQRSCQHHTANRQRRTPISSSHKPA